MCCLLFERLSYFIIVDGLRGSNDRKSSYAETSESLDLLIYILPIFLSILSDGPIGIYSCVQFALAFSWLGIGICLAALHTKNRALFPMGFYLFYSIPMSMAYPSLLCLGADQYSKEEQTKIIGRWFRAAYAVSNVAYILATLLNNTLDQHISTELFYKFLVALTSKTTAGIILTCATNHLSITARQEHSPLRPMARAILNQRRYGKKLTRTTIYLEFLALLAVLLVISYGWWQSATMLGILLVMNAMSYFGLVAVSFRRKETLFCMAPKWEKQRGNKVGLHGLTEKERSRCGPVKREEYQRAIQNTSAVASMVRNVALSVSLSAFWLTRMTASNRLNDQSCIMRGQKTLSTLIAAVNSITVILVILVVSILEKCMKRRMTEKKFDYYTSIRKKIGVGYALSCMTFLCALIIESIRNGSDYVHESCTEEMYIDNRCVGANIGETVIVTSSCDQITNNGVYYVKDMSILWQLIPFIITGCAEAVGIPAIQELFYIQAPAVISSFSFILTSSFSQAVGSTWTILLTFIYVFDGPDSTYLIWDFLVQFAWTTIGAIIFWIYSKKHLTEKDLGPPDDSDLIMPYRHPSNDGSKGH